jgi:Ser/Thr protein kinase RdoA (MazF antagonist)
MIPEEKQLPESPDFADVRDTVMLLLGGTVANAARFRLGNQHHVFDVTLKSGDNIVVRLSRPENRAAMRGAVAMSQRLRPIGVPLPRLIAHDLDAHFPCMILERLPGGDLGNRIKAAPSASWSHISSELVAAQAKVAAISFPGKPRFGYAVERAGAPFSTWGDAVADSIAAACAVIRDIGLPMRQADAVLKAAARLKPLLDEVPATPFLHDTTTKNVIVADDGGFSGIVDVDDLCFGDPRQVKALTLAALLADGLPAFYVWNWLAQAGEEADALFWLYAACSLLWLIGEHRQAVNGIVSEPPSERMRRIEGALELALGRMAGTA